MDANPTEERPVSEPARIRVSRRKLGGLLRRHTVYIDGRPQGRLRAFQTAVYPVGAGPHLIRLGPAQDATGEGRASEEIRLEVGAGSTVAVVAWDGGDREGPGIVLEVDPWKW